MSIDEAKNRGKTGQVYRCLPRYNEAMRIEIYSVMTQEEFIAILDEKGYSYKIKGDKIVVTHKGGVILDSLTSIPPGVEFRNNGRVILDSLTSLPPGFEFKNGGHVYLESLTSLPPGVEFKNVGDVDLRSLVGGWFEDWSGNIEDIDSKSLLNVMIKRGMFI